MKDAAIPAGQRDKTLDIAKGVAITLVVLGHVLQNESANFDDNPVFRVIYAFHMPLFVFLSGAVAAARKQWAARACTQHEALAAVGLGTAARNCQRALLRLFVPFATWTVILFYPRYGQMTFAHWIGLVFRSADYSLWFLLAILYCSLFFYVCEYLAAAIVRRAPGAPKRVPSRHLFGILFAASLAAAEVARFGLPNWLGITYFKTLYIYFALGGLWYLYLRPIKTRFWIKAVPALLFVLLVPFWQRTKPGPLVEFVANSPLHCRPESLYRLVVALSGTLIACGTMSLGIYAIHFHCLTIPPPVIAPLLISLAASLVLARIPGLRLVLLGESKRPAVSRR